MTSLSIRFMLLITLVTALSACVSQPELYSEADPQMEQTRDLFDLDLDGVINERDLCADTPTDAIINNDGCPTYTNRPKVKYRVINYAFDSSTLSSHEKVRVKEMARFLKKYPLTSLYLVGDTSVEGSEAYNLALAQRRIKSVHKILIAERVNPKQLKSEVYSFKNHMPASLFGRKTRLVAILQWPDDYKDYEIEWDIFTQKREENLTYEN